MSRRKQSNPRHLDSELELAHLLENGSTPDDVPRPGTKDAHVCGECRAEFLDLEVFIAHKQTCTKKRNIVMIDAENRPGDNEIQPKSPSIEYDDENIASPQDDVDIGSEENDNEINDMDSVDMSEEAYRMDMGMNGEKELDENDNFEEEDKKIEGTESEMSSQAKYELMSKLPHLFPFLPNTNVTLEPMSETKAAVAQFAENNLMPQDLAMMSATLYSLQQQQLVQLQLIQQLQQQLITGQIQNQTSPTLTSAESNLPSSRPESSAEPPAASSTPSEEKKEKDADPPSPEPSKPSVLTTSSGSTFTTPALSTPLPSSGMSAFSQLRKEAAVSSSPLLPSGPSSLSPPEHPRYRGTVLERSQYASDDPFFKHKCRFCHKVFGSDSALQIHVRSHTGERPFKCNICGNRFSTRGNLKVHFERHKAKYPHAKMNPHPQPEHLERPGNNLPMLGPFGIPPMPHIPSSLPLLPGVMTPPISTSLPMTSMGLIMPSPPIPVAPRPPPQQLLEHSESKPKETHSSPPPATEASSQKSPPEDAPHCVKSSSSPAAPPTPSSSLPAPSSTTSAPSTPITPSIPSMCASLMPSLSLPSPMPHHHAMPSYSLPPTPTSFPLPSPLAPLGMMSPFGPLPPPPPPPPPPPRPPAPSSAGPPSAPQSGENMFRNSILPTKTIDPNEDLERYMECNKSETSKLEALVKNIEQKITDPNQCVICHRVLSCKSALQMHYRIHTGERPFRCKICSRSFTTKGNLKTHMGVHRSKPPLRMMHQCPVCHKQFTNLLVLQQHIRMHTGENIHDMNHPALFRPPEWTQKHHDIGQMYDHKPFDLSSHSGEHGELDLSRSGMYGHDYMDRYGMSQDDDDFGSDDCNDEDIDMEENEMDMRDELDDAEMAEFKENHEEAFEDNLQSDPTHENHRPSSRASQTSAHNERETSSPVPSMIPSSSVPESKATPVITSAYSSPFYNTSLAALEERVKAIDSQMSQASFERFRNSMGLGHSPGLMEKLPSTYPVYQNGDKSPAASPRSPSNSEAGSEGSNMRDESHGYNSDFPVPLGMSMMSPGSLEKKNTTCNICYKTFACRSALDIHYRSHTKERPYKCEVCDRSFTTKGNMRQHMLTHKIRDLTSQSLTGNSSDSQSGSITKSEPSSPRADSRSASPSAGLEPEHKPDIQQQLSTSASSSDENHNNNNNNNNNHSKPLHSSSPVIPANLSTPHAPTPVSSSNHNSNSSDGSQFDSRRSSSKHRCMTCMKSFSSASALQIHTRTHTGDKPFKCTVCGKAFTTKGNLKVHMGTHMWSNSPSRRGRRMSIEPPFMLSHVKDNPFLAGFPHRPPDYYFQYPPFMNGMPHHKMNEISVIQSVNGMNHFPPMHHQPGMGFHLKPDHKDVERERERDRERERERERHLSDGRGSEKDMDIGRDRDSLPNGRSSPSESKPVSSSGGELDLSMRSSSSASANSSVLSSPHGKESPNDSNPYSSQAWLWKAGSCHFCNQSFQSQAALEQHIQTQHVPTSHVTGSDSQKALVA